MFCQKIFIETWISLCIIHDIFKTWQDHNFLLKTPSVSRVKKVVPQAIRASELQATLMGGLYCIFNDDLEQEALII